MDNASNMADRLEGIDCVYIVNWCDPLGKTCIITLHYVNNILLDVIIGNFCVKSRKKCHIKKVELTDLL